MPARGLFSLLFFTTCLLGVLRTASREAERSDTARESRIVPLYLRASNTMLNMELTATKAEVVKQSPLRLFSWVLWTAAVALSGVLASLLRMEKLETRKAIEATEILQEMVEGLKAAMRKQSDNLEIVTKDKVELKLQLECSRGEQQALREDMNKLEKDKGQLVDTLEIRNREMSTIKGSLTEAQGWQKECLKLDEEVNHLYQAVEERDKVVASMQSMLGDSKGWRMEQTALHNQLNELLDMLHANRDEVAGLKIKLHKAEGHKLENDRLKTEITALNQALAQHADNSAANKKMALLWKARALESEETLKGMQSHWVNKAYKEERFKACLEACIAEGSWARKCLRGPSVSASELEMGLDPHNIVAYHSSWNPADMG